MPVFYGKIAIVSYLFSILTLIVFWTKVFPPALSEPWSIAPLVLLEAAYVGVLSAFCRRQVAQVVLCSHVLGLVFAAGCLVLASGRLFVYFGAYMMSLSFFHLSEYVLTAVYNPHTLSMDSFLVNHSLEYTVAAVASWLEYWAEYYFLPEYKCLHLVNWVGLALVVGGELMRKAAMVTAGKNFTHTVMYMKRTGHRLVTKGVYAWFRHPSYVGWFYWSIGTQVQRQLIIYF